MNLAKTDKKRNLIIITILIALTFLVILGLFLVSKNIFAPKADPKSFTIMIDPGHGGKSSKDPGAIAKDGTKEYTLNDEVSKKLYNSLKKKGYNVIYSRDPDNDHDEMTLEDRINIANEKKPDLFISIHHDATANKRKEDKGYTVFYSSYRYGVTGGDVVVNHGQNTHEFISEEIVNGSTVIHYKDSNGNIKNSSSGGVFTITDNAPSEPAVKSKNLAEAVDKELYTLNYLSPFLYDSHSVTDRDFRVLRRVNTTSILIECGFLSNKDELENIKSPDNQKQLVDKITAGVNNHFNVW